MAPIILEPIMGLVAGIRNFMPALLGGVLDLVREAGIEVVNATGGSLSKGTLVYISGYHSGFGRPKVSKADADASDSAAAYVLLETIADSRKGVAAPMAYLGGFDTSGRTIGDAAWLSATAGSVSFSQVGIGQKVGRVATVSATNGFIEFDIQPVELAGIRYATASITNAQFLTLRATPITLVAAPGAGLVLEFVSVALFFDYTAAYTESVDNMAVRYTDTSGSIVSETIEATGFVDATADTMTCGIAKNDQIVAKTGCDNKALVLHNTGDGEYGGGNAANVIRARVAYRIHAAGW